MMTLNMDFASGNDRTAYLIKMGEKNMAVVSRYIALRERSTGRYIGDLQGQLVTTTLQDAYVFDIEDGDIRRIAEKMLSDEYMIEYLMYPSVPPFSCSFTKLFAHYE